MSAIRLNAAAVTAANLPFLMEPPDPLDVLHSWHERPLLLTRRDVVKLAGIAATTATGALSIRSLEPVVAPSMGVRARGAWLRSGAHHAVLDPAAFAGNPRLAVSANGTWQASLTSARFPGLAVPAGIDLLVKGSGATSRLQIRHELGGFFAEVSLADWLSGKAKAVAPVNLNLAETPIDARTRLALKGRAVATLNPDWTMRFEGRGVGEFSGFGPKLCADAVTIGLAASQSSSLLTRRVSRRTIVTLERGSQHWDLDALPAATSGAITWDGDCFDLLTLEAAETRTGASYHAAVAHSKANGDATWKSHLLPGASVGLTGVRYARTFGNEASFHLAADFASKPAWVDMSGTSLLLAATDWAEPFELSGTRRRASAKCSVPVKAIAAPFEGALASQIENPADARQVLALGDITQASTGKQNGPSASAVAPPVIISPPIDPGTIIEIPLVWASAVTITRPDDLLALRFEFYNTSLSGSGGSLKLIKTSTRYRSYLSVNFPPQHILEQAVRDPQDLPLPSPPFKSYLTGESRLAFRVPDSRLSEGVPYSIEGLLDWSGFLHIVPPVAARSVPEWDMKAYMRVPRAGSTNISEPPETSLELPWGLYLSPYPDEYWKHRTGILKKNSRTELWFTKLHGAPIMFNQVGTNSAVVDKAAVGGVTPIDPGGGIGIELPPIVVGEENPTLRAVWARHYQERLDATGEPVVPRAFLFRNSFTRSTDDIGGILSRWSVVDLCGRYHNDPIKVNNLMLTSLGAWLDSKAAWPAPDLKAEGQKIVGDLEAWDHRATMGRDQYVKIVYSGRLFPFGHRAVEITITERRVDPVTGLAFLGQKQYIMVKEPTKTYAQEADPLNRRFPFKSVTIRPEVTPQIEPSTVPGVSQGKAYWVRSVATHQDFQWTIEATDWDGKLHKFQMPLIWVLGSVATSDPVVPNTTATPLLQACASSVRARQTPLSGQAVAFAKAAGTADSDKARVMPTNWIKFDAVVVSPSALGLQRFHPVMHQANVSLDTIEKMTAQTAGTTIRIADLYRDLGYGGANAKGRVFAEIVSAASVAFPPHLSGALATPIPKFSGIGAVKGAFGGDLAQFGNGDFTPGDFFDALNAKLLGDIKLIDVLGLALGIDKMPVFSEVKDAIDSKKVKIQYDWETPVTREALVFIPKPGCKLKLHAEVTMTTEGGGSTSSVVRGELGPFDLNLVKGIIEALILKFDKLVFESVNGGTPTVDPQISDVEFVGILKYLAVLQKYLGALSGGSGSSAMALPAPSELKKSVEVVNSGPLKIDVTGQGITATLTLQLPDITVGVFSLKNMSFGAGLVIPFTGTPLVLNFNFCSRQSPFELLVMGFGGGGYILMSFQPSGLVSMEISLEFGAGTSFSIGGIASGSVEIKGGFILRYEAVPSENLKVTIFVRLHGSLRILGIISLTLTFYLDLTYESFTKPSGEGKGDKLTGTATLTVEIEILFFSFPLSLSVTKELAGKDPRFKHLMPEQADWDEYCSAFAPAKLGA